MENRIRQTVQDWESAPPSDWDTPPDALWHKIAPPPPAATGPFHFWGWIAGGVAVVLIAVFAIVASQPVAKNQPAPTQQTGLHETAANATEQPEMQEAAAIHTEGSTSATVSQSIPDAETTTDDALTTRKQQSNVTSKASLISQISQNQKQKTSAVNPAMAAAEATESPAINPPLVVAKESTAADNAPVENAPDENTTVTVLLSSENDQTAPEQDAAPTTFTPVDHLHLLSLTELEPLSAVPAALGAVPHTIKPVSGGSRFFVGAMISPNRTFRTIQSSRPVDELPAYLKENEFAAWTTEFGTRVGWMPNRRWAITSGVGIYTMQQQSLHRFRINFDPGRERPVGNGQLAGAYHLTVPSSYGDAYVELRMQRNPNNLPITPGQFINVEMEATTEIRYVTVPLNVHYFVTAGRWSAGLKGGLAMNFLQGQQFSAMSKVGQRGLATRVIAVDRRVENIRKVVPDFQLGAALWYRPHPGWLLSVEPTYRQGMQPVIERPAFNINQYAWGVQLGVQKVF
ncbi:MAG: hypothetical protein KF852_07310 [Saprospiraceae bacterium]|nr:hypothetical protein [Saprospiraceae bacterium]